MIDKNEELPDLLSVKETAAYIRSPQPSVYYLIKEGKIPAIRIGGRWKIKRKALDDMYGLGETEMPRALIVEDDPGIQKFFADYLSRTGVMQTIASTGAEAISAVKSREFDFVFLDLKLPDVGGDEVFEQIKAIYPDLSVVITTSYPDSEMLSRILNTAPVTVLKKPVDLKQLEGIVRFLTHRPNAEAGLAS
tara:strand:+ start:22083 stop:22658 length:576 start_codon:yes stop_codon:yes gene_type:complete